LTPDTDHIYSYQSSKTEDPGIFSILIPSWNNLDYLKSCIHSIRKNSAFEHQIIAISNEGSAEMQNWLRESDIDHLHSDQNLGICIGLNRARALAKCSYLLYMNDDMVVSSEWDRPLVREIEKIGHRKFMLSSTLIELKDTGTPCVIVADFGDDLSQFRAEELNANLHSLKRDDWSGSTWPPNLFPIELWDAVEGMSEEFSPGMYSDPDLSMKFWNLGVRHFQGVGDSLVYHFGSKSTGRLGKNKGRSIFFKKWGMSSRQFYRYYLKMGSRFTGALNEKSLPVFQKALNFFKRLRA
jgi:GT2 family glycosyltransferase